MQIPISISKNKISIAFFASFLLLCLLHHFAQRPLWNDEQFIINNFKQLSYAQTFGMLVNSQAFPRVHMVLIRFIAEPMNYHLLLVRLFSLITMIAAFFVWAKIYKKTFKENIGFAFVLLSFTASFSMSYYASELKPYAMDVLVVGLFMLFLSRQKELQDGLPVKRDYLIASLLPITLLFSYGGFFVVWIVGLNFLLILRKNRKIFLLFLNYAIVSSLILILSYNIDIKFSKEVQEAYSYWNSYFVCRSSAGCFFESLGEGIQRLSTWWFGNTKAFKAAASPFIGFLLYSLVRYGYMSLRKSKFCIFSVETLSAVLFLELFVFGLLRKYPFTGERITLFLAPLIFSLIVRGIMDLRRIKLAFYGFSLYYIGYLLLCYGNSFIYYVKLYK